VYFAKLHYKQQQQWVMFWYRSAAQYWVKTHENNQRKFIPYTFQVPILNDPETNLQVQQNKVPYVCMSAMQIITGKKMNFWRTCMNAVQANVVPEHGLVGKQGNATKFLPETLDDLRSFFLKIESFCDVIPTQFVREKTKQTTRDDGENLLQLPTYWSKRSLYARWCYERGWVHETTRFGDYNKKRSD
jgi:hypothetical protein